MHTDWYMCTCSWLVHIPIFHFNTHTHTHTGVQRPFFPSPRELRTAHTSSRPHVTDAKEQTYTVEEVAEKVEVGLLR